ncbi:MAG: alpha/beta hydrolase [Solirubrobacteraceae bacterium]|nr:alpha/beta hydrolase [Solirubrobacteraceae bacterium]
MQRLIEPRGPIPVVRGTKVEPTLASGVPAEWVIAPRAQDAHGKRAILYLHGGAYVFGSPRTHRTLVSRISHATGSPVLAIDYRLPPEHFPPAPTADALAAYRYLLDSGVPPEGIVIAGDSAGGNLAMELALHIVEHGLPQAAAMILLSPWTDMSLSSESAKTNAKLDAFIPADAFEKVAAFVVGPRDATDWRLSPLFAPAELLAQLPPTLVQVGSTEVLLDDGRIMAQRIAEAGVTAEVQIFDRHPHVIPVWGITPEAKVSLKEIGEWVARYEPTGIAPSPPSDADAAVAAEG